MQANPVIVKELRGRMRGWRAAVVLVIYLAVLSGMVWLVYTTTQDMGRYSASPESSQVGKFIFSTLVIFQTIMVSLLTPAFTAGSITSEKEQKTYDTLMTTLLPARSIIFGKLGSALAYVVLLILAVAPIESLAFMFGGVSPEEIILSQVVMLAAAVLFASVGIFWSTLVRTSIGSNVLTYGTIIVQMLIIPFIYAMTTFATSFGITGSEPDPASYYTSLLILSSNPLIAMVWSDAMLLQGEPLFVGTSTTALSGHTLLVVSPWLIFCIEALLISALLVLISIRKVRPVRERSSRRHAAPATALAQSAEAPEPQTASEAEPTVAATLETTSKDIARDETH